MQEKLRFVVLRDRFVGFDILFSSLRVRFYEGVTRRRGASHGEKDGPAFDGVIVLHTETGMSGAWERKGRRHARGKLRLFVEGENLSGGDKGLCSF